MHIYYRPKHLMEILHYTDDTGKFEFVCDYHQSYEDELKALDNKELTKEIFSLTPLFLDRDKLLSNNYIKKLKPKYEICTEQTEEGEVKYIVFSANVLNYFGLPAENPKEEIEALFDFFCKIRQVYLDFYNTFKEYNESVGMQIFTCHSNLYDCLEFRVNKEDAIEQQWLDEKAKMLLNEIKQSAALTAWLKHTRRVLNMMGPYSWQNYDSESFFDYQEDPYKKRWQENYGKKRN